MVTDAAGTVVSEQLSLPFGNMMPFTQTYGGENSYQHPTLSNPSKKRFTTYDRSDVTTLDYAKNRFYSPQQGRFTQVDPIGMGAAELANPQSLNLYAYVENDPINSTDPLGLDGSTFVWSWGGPFPVPTGGGGGGGGLRIGPFSLGFSFGFGGKMPPTIPGIHCCRDDLRPPAVAQAIIKWLFSDYVDEPGDASNTISQGLRGPSAQWINPGTVGAQIEVVIADTNVATAILRGVKLSDLGLAPGAHVVITQTIYSEMLRADGVVKEGLDKALERAQIEVRSVSLDALKSVGKELRGLVSLGSLPLEPVINFK